MVALVEIGCIRSVSWIVRFFAFSILRVRTVAIAVGSRASGHPSELADAEYSPALGRTRTYVRTYSNAYVYDTRVLSSTMVLEY